MIRWIRNLLPGHNHAPELAPHRHDPVRHAHPDRADLMRPGKTGGQNTAWVELSPKPPRVDADRYWVEPPPRMSPRCVYWLEQIQRGWRPNKAIRRHCNQCAAEWYGVYIWEIDHVIAPALRQS